MRKLLYLGFCLVLAAGVGCAITDYTLITDNDQVKQGAGNATVNTNGKAHIRSFQIATLWGTSNDELINFVDQKSNGDRTLTTYNNFSTSADPTFHDDMYCNPDWQGCAIWTAHDPPGDGFSPAYDGVWNQNCSGSRSLYLLAYTIRGGSYNYGECGRGGNIGRNLALWNMGQPGSYLGIDGLWYHFDRNNSYFAVNGQAVPVMEADLFMDPVGKKAAIDISHPLTTFTLRAFDEAAPGDDATVNVTFMYNGYTIQKGAKKVQALSNAIQRRF